MYKSQDQVSQVKNFVGDSFLTLALEHYDSPFYKSDKFPLSILFNTLQLNLSDVESLMKICPTFKRFIKKIEEANK